jgi:hypothetical protein
MRGPGRDIMYCGEKVPQFSRNLLSSASTLKLQVAGSTKSPDSTS